MKRISYLIKAIGLVAILSILVFITNSVVSADNNIVLKEPQQTSDGFKYSISNGTAIITGYSGDNQNIVIPDTISGYTVTKIDSRAFYYNAIIKHVILPSGLKTIGFGAFEMCTSLEDVSMPESVEIIEDLAFRSCNNLSGINIPKNVKQIGSSVFAYDTSLTSIIVDENNNYFSSKLGILFDKDKTELICYPQSKIETAYSVPETVRKIHEYSFLGCQSLKNVDIPEGVTEIGERAFQGCRELEYAIIPGTVLQIEPYTFANSTSIKNIKILNSVTKINSLAFKGCSSLERVFIPASVTEIAANIFENTNTDNITIHCNKNTAAEQFAIDNDINYVYMSGEEPVEDIKGDLNSDGKITATDLLIMKRIIVKIISASEKQITLGDLNNDGKITATDLLILKRKVVHLG